MCSYNIVFCGRAIYIYNVPCNSVITFFNTSGSVIIKLYSCTDHFGKGERLGRGSAKSKKERLHPPFTHPSTSYHECKNTSFFQEGKKNLALRDDKKERKKEKGSLIINYTLYYINGYHHQDILL